MRLSTLIIKKLYISEDVDEISERIPEEDL